MCTISFPTRTATLIREVDKRVMVSLRDGRTLIGYLRTIDQFANLVLHKTVERIHVGTKYGDIPRGVFLVRGENVLLIGEVDPYRELNQPIVQVGAEEILGLRKDEMEQKKNREKLMEKLVKGKNIKLETKCDDMY